jgi:hypothetical protein
MSTSIDKPVVNGDDGAWGDKLNTALDVVVAAINVNETAAAAKLPLAGGALTGRVDAKTATQAHTHLASGASITFDLSSALSFDNTVTGATTFAFSNVPATTNALLGVIVRLVNGGSAAMTFPGSVKWPGGTAPALTAAGTDMLVFLSDDAGVTWRGVLAAKDVK